MKYFYLFILTISYFNLYSQDILEKTDGTEIKSKVEEISIDKIKYYRYDNLSGPVFIILKSDVSKITFENGIVEIINPSLKYEPVLLEETKKIIMENITEYGFEHANPRRPYVATFDGDYLRLAIPDPFETKTFREGTLYNFSEVRAFHRISKRKNNVAYVNVVVSTLRNKKKNTWFDNKMVIRVQGRDKAEIIMKSLKDYNKLLLLRSEKEAKKENIDN